MLLFKKDEIKPVEIKEEKNAFDSFNPEQKTLSYETLILNNQNGMFRNEFDQTVSKENLLKFIVDQPSIGKAVHKISEQFMSTEFILKDGETEITSNPIIDLLNNPKSESSSLLWTVICMDLILTGEAYLVPNVKEKRLTRMPSVNVTCKRDNNNIKYFEVVSAKGGISKFDETTMIQIKLPNPFDIDKGMSKILSAVIPMVNDKYSQEFITSYFLRGGSAATILETNQKNAGNINRLLNSIMQSWSGRSNIGQHKVLPEGTKLIAQGETLGQSQIIDKLKELERAVISHLGVPPSLVGQTDGVNYANGVEQMKSFWLTTILPLQKLICSAIEESVLFQNYKSKGKITLTINNEHNIYLSDYDKKVEQDAKLAKVLTVNERRKLIGFDPIAGGDELPSQGSSFQDPNLQPQDVQKLYFDLFKKKNLEVKALKKPVVPQNVKNVYKEEFKAWESIVLEHIKNKEQAIKIIRNRNETFALKLTRNVKPYAMKEYSRLMKRTLKKSMKLIVNKDYDTDAKRRTVLEKLAERADQVMNGLIATRSRDYFVGYSENQMERVYALIDEMLKQDVSLDAIASAIRGKFSEFYQGQASTIIRTEFLSSTALAFGVYEDDLSSVSNKMKKTWLTLEDDRTRDSHSDMDGEEVVFNTGEEGLFSNGLRYPRDNKGDASEVINCRCSVEITVVDWK